ncbi:MAG: hypothetical protein E7036_03035 [Opitutales bacterium]|nr:hypothetical protein [Opitutales bacterium]
MMKRKLLVVAMALCTSLLMAEIKLNWQVGASQTEKDYPQKFIPAEVPGAVQLDFAKALKLPDYRFGINSRAYRWLEDRYYTYKVEFAKPALSKNKRLLFKCESIDYRFKIYVNKNLVVDQEGMFTPVNVDITDFLKNSNLLEVVVFPAPKAYPDENFDEKWYNENPLMSAVRGKNDKVFKPKSYRMNASKSFKPPVSYEWDWHPRLIPLGICGEAKLEVANASRLNDVYVKYSLSDDLKTANINLNLEGVKLAETSYKWKLLDESGKLVKSANGKISADCFVSENIEFANPELWWPNGHGKAYLYDSIFELYSDDGKLLETDKQKVGFKRVKFVPNRGAWSEPSVPAKTRSVPPMQLEINGREIFVKGSNWVNPEIFPAKVSDERYEILTDYAVDLNFNMLRMWGGAPVARKKFFEICDKKGLLVWQEFILGCNFYPDEEAYLKVLRQEATSIVKKLRKHVCMACWRGGNELYNSWSRMTEQSLPLRWLNSITLQYNPEIPFNATSPIMGVAHGPYHFFVNHNGERVDIFQYWQTCRFTAYCEFGISAMSPVETIRKTIPANEIFPVRPTPAWIEHHAFKTNDKSDLLKGVHSNYYASEVFCGESKSIEELIEKTQFMQAQAYRFMFEETRRQKPYCSMAINWCFNDAWEGAGNQSIIAYPTIKKQSYETVKQACRPVLASARFAKFTWKPNEKFAGKAFILNDYYKSFDPMTINIKVEFDGKVRNVRTLKSKAIQPNKNEFVGNYEFKIPDLGKEIRRFKLILEVEGKPEFSSEYSFVYYPDFKINRDKEFVEKIKLN